MEVLDAVDNALVKMRTGCVFSCTDCGKPVSRNTPLGLRTLCEDCYAKWRSTFTPEKGN